MKLNNEVKIFKNRSIIKFEGDDFLGEIGIDGRIFKALTFARISVGVISQQASEKGVSVLVSAADAERAVSCLIEEFSAERKSGKVRQIYSINNVSVISFSTADYSRISQELGRNNIFPLIVSQVLAEQKVNIIVVASQDEKAKTIIEAEIFDKPKILHLAIFGGGKVTESLVGQILESAEDIRRRKKLHLKIFAVSNLGQQILSVEEIGVNWEEELAHSAENFDVQKIADFAKNHQLENLIAIDNSTSRDVVEFYPLLAENGFDLVSSNKTPNTLQVAEYRNLRHVLLKNNRKFLYEATIGAGLPLIDTIKLLHLSGENITKIRGVFSGALSYIFNNFSTRDEKFSVIFKEAFEKGFTADDPRENLSGADAAKKLLILARELELVNEINDVNVKSIISEDLSDADDFVARIAEIDEEFETLKAGQQKDHVLRFVGELHGDLQQEKGQLDFSLQSVPVNSPLGQLKEADSIFEIYTESYGDNPLVIMGPGAGAKVTARAVFGDILRISEAK